LSTNEAATALPFVFVDYASSPQDALAKDIVSLDRPNPSDLTGCIIWCDTRTQIHSIKLSLARAAQADGIEQLLLPTVITLEDWVWQQQAPIQTPISETNKRLILVDAIRQSPALFQTNNAWPLAKELVSLFNECTLAQIPLQAGEQVLHEILQESYQYPATEISNISRESEIVYRLWQAYREQIEARGWIDPVEHYCQWLIKDTTYTQTYLHYYVVGKHRLSAAEAIFFNNLKQSHSVSIYSPKVSVDDRITHHHPHIRYIENTENIKESSNERQRILDIIYSRKEVTYERIQQLKNTQTNQAFNQWLSLYTCNSIEKHVSAVCLQAKKWLIEGINSIGIIVNDRLLARRIRAVLEEQGIQPNDLGGWTLSTTSAATSIEVLLDAIENNFKKDALLDLLSSPFMPCNNNPESDYALQTYSLRKYLKKHRNTPSDNLTSMIALTTQYFENQEADAKEILDTLNNIQSSCEALHNNKQAEEYDLLQLSDQLLNTLKSLGIYTALENDVAGQQLITTLDIHIQSARTSSIKLNWKEWRQWLRDIFEHNYFIPENTDKRITLCGFEHTDNLKFDAVIIAGVEENRLSNSKQRTFFNEKVCHELSLPTSHESNAINFVRFRQLLQQSNIVLMSAEIEKHGEPQEISPWVKLINLFSEQAYGIDIINTELDNIIHAYNQHKQNNDFSNNKAIQPQPTAPAKLIPTRISATQYQSLIDCPYQYFAKYVLKLRDYETADEFEASDYGMLVHQCLYEFHFKDENKTSLAFNNENRAELIKQLSDLSTSIFMHAPFAHSTKHAWLHRWLSNVPAYIQWATERAKQWRGLRGESLIQAHLNDTFSLYGQIDRIDSDTQNLAVIDYKTGSTKPSKKNVLNGEVVQLPFYALLDDNITQAEYVSLGVQGEVKSIALLSEDEISALKSAHQPRLENLFSALLNEAKLKAQGDDATCRVCDYQGLCRKQHWH